MNGPSSKSGTKTFWAISLPVGVTVFLLVALTGTLITFILPKSYLSEARIKVATTNAGQAGNLGIGKTAAAEIEVIGTSQILQDVVERLELNKKWGDRYSNGETLPIPLCIQILRNQLELKPVKNTDLIRIGVHASTPSEAATVANAVASAYAHYCKTTAQNVTVVVLEQAVENPRPNRPKVTANIVLSIVLGGVIGMVVGGGCGWLVCLIRRKANRTTQIPRSPSLGDAA